MSNMPSHAMSLARATVYRSDRLELLLRLVSSRGASSAVL